MATQRVFISYRRRDSGQIVERMFDVLATMFGPENIFRDVDSIDTGVRFDAAIKRAIKQCNVFLAVIGDSWLSAESEDGTRRLDRPDDPVRLEIETALQNQIPAIPVLVHGGKMPDTIDLPEVLQQLSRINAFVINDSSFHSDLRRLCGSLRDYDPAAFARKMGPARWEQLVIPNESRNRLMLAFDDVKFRKRIHLQWGFKEIGFNESMTIGIWGPAGCGKTLAARCFAQALGLDLYQINLEEALLRWNVGDRLPIDWLFRRSVANPVLLQLRDISGAFSSTPKGPKESILLAASLLRQIQDREGFMIVTSRSSLRRDTVSLSRFDHIIEFPFPDAEVRQAIWERSMPQAMPVLNDIDAAALARHPLSGMSICRVVKRAAVYAARQGQPVCMAFLEEAARMEQAE
jgi:hypothetical protein